MCSWLWYRICSRSYVCGGTVRLLFSCVFVCGLLSESGNFAKIMHLLWKLRYRNKIIGCKYKRTSCNKDICRMRANGSRIHTHFIFQGIKNCTCRSKYTPHRVWHIYYVLAPFDGGNCVHIYKSPVYAWKYIYICRRTENTVQYLTALIEKHNLWLQTESERERERICVVVYTPLLAMVFRCSFVQPNFLTLGKLRWILCAFVQKWS